ncbi:MAG: hypothetical protein H7Z41_08560, partial [Cytophagales bacterium]|nr:hypothetical protein [Armatimonadota bacterium]
DLRLDIPGHGGFAATVITGRDGKSPVVVENNTVWPIPRAIKGKAKPLAYSDSVVGVIRGDGTNANYGAFSLSGSTGAVTVTHSKATKQGTGCCAAPVRK